MTRSSANITQPVRIAATFTSNRELLQRQIADVDNAIDAQVYALYGLKAEEINIIETT